MNGNYHPDPDPELQRMFVMGVAVVLGWGASFGRALALSVAKIMTHTLNSQTTE